MRVSTYSQSRLALGGTTTLTIVTEASSETMGQFFTRLWRHIFEFERRFSRFIPMSELSSFNRSAGLRIPISIEFRELLRAAKHMSERTEGLYNPFVLPALQRAGYIHSAVPGYEQDTVDDFSTRTVVGIDMLEVTESRASIPHGTAIDLGGCGKGYLADRLRELLDAPYIHGYWVNMSGDITTFGRDERGKQWEIYIQDAYGQSAETNWAIRCPEGYFGIATSGTAKRPGQRQGNWHHIINPKTMRSAKTDIRLATVCAPSCLEADVLASCALILGSKEAEAKLIAWGATALYAQCERGLRKFTVRFGNDIIVKSPERQSLKGAPHA